MRTVPVNTNVLAVKKCPNCGQVMSNPITLQRADIELCCDECVAAFIMGASKWIGEQFALAFKR